MSAPLTTPGGGPPRLARPRGGAVLIAVSAALIGFLVVGEIRETGPPDPALTAESEGDLARILAALNAEADALQAEITELKVQLNEARRSTESDEAATEAAAQQLRSLQVLAGAVPVTGPGVEVRIEDPGRLLAYDSVIDVIQELRDAGAEALAVNDRRVGVATAFAERERAITVDGEVLAPPYRIDAVGQAATLEGGLKIPGGAVDALSAVKGVRVEVVRRTSLALPALREVPEFDVARPLAERG